MRDGLDEAVLRAQAARCRRLMRELGDDQGREALRQLAERYDAQANAVAAANDRDEEPPAAAE